MRRSRPSGSQVVTKVFDPERLSFGKDSALLHAMKLLADDKRIDNLKVISRWFALFKLLTSFAKKEASLAFTFKLRAIKPANMIAALKAGGPEFIRAGRLFQNHDAIDSLVIPIARSAQGRAWLRDHKADVKIALGAADASQATRLKDLVDRYAKSQSPDLIHWAEMVRGEWSL